MSVQGPRGGTYKNDDQKKMMATWRTKAWIARRDEVLKAHPRCQWCNGKSGVINHRRQGYYEGYELCRLDEIDIICQPCHLEWTKTGKKRPRLYDDCNECEAPIYIGRKVCFSCGSKSIISKISRTPEQQETFRKILSRCPEVRIGDVWANVWAWPFQISIVGFEKQELPWPLVKVAIPLRDNRNSVGLPAFIFGKLVSVGDGKSSEQLDEK